MKRPLATALLGFLAVVAAAFLVSFWAAAALAAGLLAFVLARWRRWEKLKRAVALWALALAALALVVSGVSLLRAERLDAFLSGNTHKTLLRITDSAPEQNQYTARVVEAGGRFTAGATLVFYTASAYEVGDELLGEVEFYGARTAAGGLDDAVAFNGRLLAVYSAEPGANAFGAALYSIRSAVSRAILQLLPGDEGALAAAMITGQKSLLSGEVQLSFQRAGVSHIVVVSGLHITALLGMLYWVIKKLRLPAGVQFGLLAAFAVFAALLYGLTPSVVRAAVMSLVLFGAGLLLRRSDPPTTLALAAFLILIVNPAAVGGASFLLSFGCVFAITVAAPALKRHIERSYSPKTPRAQSVFKKGLDIALAPLCITLVTLPVLIYFKMPVSLVSPLTNLLAVPLVPVLIALAVAAAALQLTLPFFVLSNIVGFFCGLVARVLLWVSSLFSSLELAAVTTSAPYLRLWLVFALAAIALYAAFLKKKVGKKLLGACLAFTLLCGGVSNGILSYTTPAVLFYNGEAVVVCERGSAVVIINEPGENSLRYLSGYLSARFINDIDCVIITGKPTTEAARAAQNYFKGSRLLLAYDYGLENAELLQGGVSLRLGDADIYAYPDATVHVSRGGVRLCFTARADAPAADIVSYYRGAEPAQQPPARLAVLELGQPPPGLGEFLQYEYGDVLAYYFVAADRCNIIKE